MPAILVLTDFSGSSLNALDYICALMEGRDDVQLFIVHIYSIPGMYTGDGIALTTINSSFADAAERLQEEEAWVRHNYPTVKVTARATLGGFLASLKEQVADIHPGLVVVGAAMHDDESWLPDADTTEAFIDLPVPVISIPQHIVYAPLRNIGFACNVRYIGPHTPLEAVKNVLQFTGAKLHVVFITPPGGHDTEIMMLQKQLFVEEAFKDYAPAYYAMEENHVVKKINPFIQEQQIDLLLVIPRREGFWNSLFLTNSTKALAHLHTVPVLALRENQMPGIVPAPSR